MTPLYAQMKNYILSNIQSGNWSVGARVPSEHELVAQFKVSRMTANRALRELADAGLVRRVAGSGSFVAEHSPASSTFAFPAIADSITARGGHYSQHRETIVQLLSPPVLSDAFAISTSLNLFHLRIIHSEDDQPVQLEDFYVRVDHVPNFDQQDFNLTTPHAFIRGKLKPIECEYTITATMPDAMQQRALQIRSTEPCLSLRYRYWQAGVIIAISTAVSPANGFSLQGRIAD
jgi:GntR family transcriptional regulator, histidine utilization repressor